MHRIDTKTAQKDKFGAGKNGFTRGNPQTGTPATDLDDDYFDMLQEELCSVVEASGASLEKARHDQLLTALRALLLSRKNPFGDIKSDGTVQTALENLGAVNANGGNYNGYFNFKQIGTIGSDNNQSYLVSPETTTANALATWLQNMWNGNAVSWGVIRGESNNIKGAGIDINGNIIFELLPDGSIKGLGKLFATQEWANGQFPLKTSLGNASTKTVGTGAGQIPDMTSFQSGSNELGTWVRHPSGILIQFGVYPFSSTTGGIRFPTPFSEAPSYCLSPTSDIGVMAVSSGSTPSMISDVRTFNAAGVMQNNGVSWIAIGR